MNAGTSPTLMSNYGRLDVVFTHGSGPYLFDTEGRRYLDALCGIAVCSLGHAHPDVARALYAQATRLVHTSNLYRIDLQEQLADRLTELSGMERTFFCNSGAEANEAALKIARRHGNLKGVATPTVIAMDGSFHGRTMATLSATGNPKVHAGFEPLVEGFVHAPYGDADAVSRLSQNENVVAVLVEPVQGEGGVVIPPTGYLKALRELCDKRELLLIVDEVQAGMGRTGRWFGYQHEEIVPDVITLAKALGNGVPIGACLARGAAAEILQPGTHGSTFGGNPLASSAALAVIRVVERDGLLERAADLGERILSGLKAALARVPEVEEVRGRGLMLGITLDRSCAELVKLALADGLLINVTADRVIRLLPPSILSNQQADELVSKLSRLIIEFLKG